MRSPREISVGNGWYWLAGAIVAVAGIWFYVAAVDRVLPALAWHRTHSRKMQFDAFSLDVPLLWYVPKADFQQPNDIEIDKVAYYGYPISSIELVRGKGRPCIGCLGRATEMMKWLTKIMRGNPRHSVYPLAAENMDCVYDTNPAGSYMFMRCFGQKTNAELSFRGSSSDFAKLRQIVH